MIKKMSFLVTVLALIFGCAGSAPAGSAASTTPAPAASAQVGPMPTAPVITLPPIVINPNPGPGPYKGSCYGMHGMVGVTLEVENGTLTSFVVNAPADAALIGALAVDTLPDIVLKANSLEVDMVSGATHTSVAILRAGAIALGEAGLTNADLKH